MAPPPSDLAGAVDGILATGGADLAYLPYIDGEVLDRSVSEALAAGVAPTSPSSRARPRTSSPLPDRCSLPCWPPAT